MPISQSQIQQYASLGNLTERGGIPNIDNNVIRQLKQNKPGVIDLGNGYSWKITTKAPLDLHVEDGGEGNPTDKNQFNFVLQDSTGRELFNQTYNPRQLSRSQDSIGGAIQQAVNKEMQSVFGNMQANAKDIRAQKDAFILKAAQTGNGEYSKAQNDLRNEFTNTEEFKILSKLRLSNVFHQNKSNIADIGGGMTAVQTTQRDSGGRGWGKYTIFNKDGQIISEVVNRGQGSELNREILSGLAASKGYNPAFVVPGQKNSWDVEQNALQALGLSGAKGYWDKQYKEQRALEESQNFGTFVNNLGKTVVAHTLKDAQGMKALGFAQKAAGTTMTPEQQAQFNQSQGSAYGVRQDLQAIANGSTQQTADAKFYQQQADMRAKGIDTNLVNHLTNEDGTINQDQQAKFNQLLNGQPMAQNNLTMASAGQDPNITPTSTAPTTPQINFKSGLNDAQKQSITNLINKGTVLNENDAKNVAYALGINDYTQFVGKTGQEAIGSSAGQPTRDTMQANVMQVAQTQPMQKATTDFITQAFESAHGRVPTADEIARYQNKTTADALTEIQGGAPQPKTQADLDLMNQGFERILNPQSLEDLKAAGLDPSKIVKVGNKLYKPGSFSVDSSSAAMPSEFTGAKGTIKTDGLGVGGNAKYTAGVTAAANDYYGQYLEQIAPQFYADRQSYWNSVLTSSDFREKTLLNLEDKYQLDELSKNLTDIDAKIAAKNTAYSTLINDIENQPMSMARIVGESNHVRKLQAVEINSLLAQREAIQGNYDRAEKMMTNMYNAKVADYTDNIAAMKDWYSEQKDFFTKQEQRSYDAKIKEEERNFELYKDELSSVRDIMKDYPTAGISLNDSFSEAIAKLGALPASVDPDMKLQFNPVTGDAFIVSKYGIEPYDPYATTTPASSGGNYTLVQQGNGEAFQCGTWARSLGDYAGGVGMGDSLAEKQAWINKYGSTDLSKVSVGDLVVTNGSDVAGGQPTVNGHALIVGAIANGKIYAYEANARGDRAVTFGREVPIQSVVGYVGGNMKPAEFQKMQKIAMAFDPAKQSQSTTNNTSNNIAKFIDKLPPKILDTVIAKADDFKNETIVKDYLNVAPNYQLTQNIANTSTNPADSNSLIYAFAKTMDPGGRVTESDYDSATKIQSLFQKYGLQAKGIFSSTGVLTPEAKADLKKSIAAKFKVHEDSFNALVDNYAQVRIAPYTSRYGGDVNNAKNWLLDYAKTYTGATATPQTQKIQVKRNRDGLVGTIDASDFNPDTYTKI